MVRCIVTSSATLRACVVPQFLMLLGYWQLWQAVFFFVLVFSTSGDGSKSGSDSGKMMARDQFKGGEMRCPVLAPFPRFC